jgi:hypothetical protein
MDRRTGDDHIAESQRCCRVPFDVCQWEIFVDGRSGIGVHDGTYEIVADEIRGIVERSEVFTTPL